MAASQAESSSALSEPQTLAVQVASVRAPWQLAGLSQVAGEEYPPGQLTASAQQSPEAQQKPFWQWSLTQSEFSSQPLPSPRSAWQLPSQWAPGSHSSSRLQEEAQTGVDWSWVSSQKTEGYSPQSLTIMVASQAVSSSALSDPQTLAVQVASVRVPWQLAGSSQLGAE